MEYFLYSRKFNVNFYSIVITTLEHKYKNIRNNNP